MDNFQVFLKKQLLEYVKSERKKGIPLEQIEKALLDAGHNKNIVDEVFIELRKEQAGQKVSIQGEVEKDLTSMLKKGLKEFMAQAREKDIKDAKKDIKEGKTSEIVNEVIQEAEVIEEKLFLETIAFFIYLVGIGLMILVSAGATDSSLVNVAIGFSPAIISVFVSFLGMRLADFVPLYVFIPLLIASIFFAIGKFTGLFPYLDVDGLSIVNFLIGFVFNILVVYIKFVKPSSWKRRVINKKPTPFATQISSQQNETPETSDFSTEPSKRPEIEELRREFT